MIALAVTSTLGTKCRSKDAAVGGVSGRGGRQAPGPVSVALLHAQPRPAHLGAPTPRQQGPGDLLTLTFERHCLGGPDHKNHFSSHELMYAERICESSVTCWAPAGARWAQRWVAQEQRSRPVGETHAAADQGPGPNGNRPGETRPCFSVGALSSTSLITAPGATPKSAGQVNPAPPAPLLVLPCVPGPLSCFVPCNFP